MALLLLFAPGCPFPADPGDPSGNDPGDQQKSPFTGANGDVSFANAVAVDLSSNRAAIEDAIVASPDIHMFKLAPLAPGDRLVIDVQRISGNLDAVAAVFDSRQRVMAFNDDRTPDGSNRNPRLDFIIRGDEGVYPSELFLGLVSFPGSGSTGAYEISIQVTREVGVPIPDGQIIFLDYRGGENILVPNVGRFNLEPFAASDLGGRFASRNAQMKRRIEAIVADRYAGYNLTILNSDQHAQPSTPHSVIYFGGNNRRAFAISEAIDTLNQNPSDAAIIFTRSFDDAFSSDPDFEQMATAVGNTVAHEVGHLLGLVHTRDCGELMDATCGNDRIISKQEFGDVRLDPFVFPIGFQDANLILEWVLGFVGM